MLVGEGVKTGETSGETTGKFCVVEVEGFLKQMLHFRLDVVTPPTLSSPSCYSSQLVGGDTQHIWF